MVLSGTLLSDLKAKPGVDDVGSLPCSAVRLMALQSRIRREHTRPVGNPNTGCQGVSGSGTGLRCFWSSSAEPFSQLGLDPQPYEHHRPVKVTSKQQLSNDYFFYALRKFLNATPRRLGAESALAIRKVAPSSRRKSTRRSGHKASQK